MIKCPHCRKVYKYQYALDIHIMFHHSDEDTPTICPFCDAEYDTECGLLSHVRYCSSNPGRVDVTPETRAKIRDIHTGMHHSEQTKIKISMKNKGMPGPNKGKAFTSEHKKKLSEAHKGKKASPETKKKLSDINKGKVLSEEHKKKISDSNKGKIITDEQIIKAKQTCMERYGSECFLQSEEGIKKSKESCMEKYGAENYMQSDQAKIDSYKKYGVAHPCQSDAVKIKTMLTNIEKYGDGVYMNTEDFKSKTKTTNIEKYGDELYIHSEDFNIKKIITCLKKYGVYHYAHTIQSHHNRKARIEYEGEYFDSQPELDFYLLCKAENKEIKRHPIRLEYLYESQIHYYFPDFEVDNELVEIKGKHFINPETGKWWNPFDHSQDGKYAAKFDCAIRNGVKIIYV